jgi:hypothetical protein
LPRQYIPKKRCTGAVTDAKLTMIETHPVTDSKSSWNSRPRTRCCTSS